MTEDLLKTIEQESKSHNEHNDCAVRTVSILTGYSYDDVLYTFGLCGRKPRKGTKWETTEKAIHFLRFRMVNVTDNFSAARTIRTLERRLKWNKGRYLVKVRGHILPIVDGQVYDWSKGRCYRILNVYKMVEVSEEFHQAEKRNVVYTSPPYNMDTQNITDVTHTYKMVGCKLVGDIKRIFLTNDNEGPVFVGIKYGQ